MIASTELPKEILNARVVGVGESTHASASMRSAVAVLVERLIREAGVDALFVEGSAIGCRRLQDRVGGKLDEVFDLQEIPEIGYMRRILERGGDIFLSCMDAAPRWEFWQRGPASEELARLPPTSRLVLSDFPIIASSGHVAHGVNAAAVGVTVASVDYSGPVDVACYWGDRQLLSFRERLEMGAGDTLRWNAVCTGEMDVEKEKEKELLPVPCWCGAKFLPQETSRTVYVDITTGAEASFGDVVVAEGPARIMSSASGRGAHVEISDVDADLVDRAIEELDLYLTEPHLSRYEFVNALRFQAALKMWDMHDPGDVLTARDEIMSQVVLRFLERYPESRVVAFAHNLHVMAGDWTRRTWRGRRQTMAGAHLREALGDDYVAVAGLMGPGLVSWLDPQDPWIGGSSLHGHTEPGRTERRVARLRLPAGDAYLLRPIGKPRRIHFFAGNAWARIDARPLPAAAADFFLWVPASTPLRPNNTDDAAD